MGRSCGSYFHGGFCFDAEVKGLELASHIGQAMQVHHLNLHIIKSWHPGHWTIRPNLYQFVSYMQNVDATLSR
jgi:hypothetical protein